MTTPVNFAFEAIILPDVFSVEIVPFVIFEKFVALPDKFKEPATSILLPFKLIETPGAIVSVAPLAI